jgi:short-subunit dehydrogenase
VWEKTPGSAGSTVVVSDPKLGSRHGSEPDYCVARRNVELGMSTGIDGHRVGTSGPRTALVTGASSGIGEAFARELASRGFGLVITARRVELLERLAVEIRANHGVAVLVVTADLASPGGVTALLAGCADLEIDLLVNNAGFGTYTPFVEIEPDRIQQEMALNMVAPVTLSRALLPPMIERGHGGIINISSTAGFQPVTRLAVYASAKAFLLNFSEALWAECRGTGVRVLALCPGPTRTEFFGVAGGELVQAFSKFDTPEEVVRVGLKALREDRSFRVVGLRNYLLAMSTRLAPRQLVARFSRRDMKLKSA